MKFQIDKSKMKMLSIKKSKFSKINDKRCHFPNVILYLPFRHLLLNKTKEMKTKYIKKYTIILQKVKKIF